MTYHHTHNQNREQTVFALHSSASSGCQWKSLALDSEHRFNVCAPDLPGYGNRKMNASSHAIGVGSVAEPVANLIEMHGRPVHLVGHSNGAGIALKIALTRPDLVKSLTLYEPATFHFLADGSPEDRRHYGEINLISGQLAAAVVSGDGGRGMRKFIDFWNGSGSWARLNEFTRQKLTEQAMSVMADFSNGFSEQWELADLKQIEIPTLIMMGLESPGVAQTVASQIASAIPSASLAMLPGLNHMAPITNPNWVNPRICQHIANVERPMARIPWPAQNAA